MEYHVWLTKVCLLVFTKKIKKERKKSFGISSALQITGCASAVKNSAVLLCSAKHRVCSSLGTQQALKGPRPTNINSTLNPQTVHKYSYIQTKYNSKYIRRGKRIKLMVAGF